MRVLRRPDSYDSETEQGNGEEASLAKRNMNSPRSVKSIRLEKPPSSTFSEVPLSEYHNLSVSEWLTTNEAAAYLKVKARTLLQWARQGKIKGYTLSGVKRHVWRFRKVDLDGTLEVPSVRSEGRTV
ncbi:MAG: hypothetical protein DMG65_06570 [Candidatus Angelobacter sp. Gp1-AA117]|nr:MAG: hypothetical protein DMG65_06570 [Candidatus Angelobacter sp. Gp1-AA117]